MNADDVVRVQTNHRLHRLEQIVATWVTADLEPGAELKDRLAREVERGMLAAQQQAFAGPPEGESLAFELGYMVQKGRQAA